jgi:hypothetical protein
MNDKTLFQKEPISIQKIGKWRFWMGTAAGLITALSLSLAFNYTRETFRFFTGMSADLLIPEEAEWLFFNNFFAALAAALGLSAAIAVWMSGPARQSRKDRLYRQLALTYALLIFWVSLMMLARFGSILSIILFGLPGYDDDLNLYEDYRFLFILFPIVVFLQSWFSVRLVYRAEKWMLISFVCCIAGAFLLSKTTAIRRDIVNDAYVKRFEREYAYIDEEVGRATRLYGADFEDQTVATLKKRHLESAYAQVRGVKSAFPKGRQVTLDTIILQKIILHNCKRGGRAYYPHWSPENWPYALPEDVLKQIGLFEADAPEVRELFEVLKLQIGLVNKQETDGTVAPDFSAKRRGSCGAYRPPGVIISRLAAVSDSLLRDERYVAFHVMLPDILRE